MKHISVIILCLLSNFLFAHTINYEKIILKHWTIEKENKTIDGSFYMLKNETVYIEDVNSNVVAYPLASLSKEDQAFALHKNQWVKQLNNQQLSDTNQPVQVQSIFNCQFWLVIALLVALSVFIFSFTEKRKLKFLVPVLLVGVCMILYSFTQKAMQSMQSITSPTFIDSAFAPFKPNVNTFWDTAYFYVESKGIPTTHAMMSGITNWQQQVPIPQCYIGNNAWSIPLNPVVAATPVPVSPAHFTRGAIAVAVNGIAIFNPYTNTGADAFITGQLDNWGGHCGRADDYHYHIAPMSLYNFTSATMPIAFALDGFAVYGNLEPDGSSMAPLDTNNGHFGTTGVYHYHGVPAAPYMIGNMVGQVTEDATFQIIPQPNANPVRPGQNPLPGAVITNCQPNATNNGYTLTYTLSGNTDSIVYNWMAAGLYTFNFYTAAGSTTSTYNGFTQCVVPTSLNDVSASGNNLLIYPNPNNGIFRLQLNNDVLQNDVRRILIYNIQGDLIFQTEHYQSNMEIKDIAKGIYLMQIQFTKNQLTKKLIVQ